MRRRLIRSLIALSLFGGGAFAFGRWTNDKPFADFSSMGPTIGQLRTLSELVTLKVPVSDIVTGEDDRYRGVWLIRGDALLSVNLDAAEISQVDLEGRTAQLLLPAPSVLHARVDHERTRVWNIEKKTWLPFTTEPPELRDNAMREAQRAVEKAVGDPEQNQQARNQAERIIGRFYEALGWKITINWKS